MNWKPTWGLLAAVAVGVALILFVEQPLRRQKELQASRILLSGLNPELITNIEIQPWGQALIQAERESSNTWRLTRPVSYPAQNQFVQSFLEAMAKLEWV